MKNQIEKWHKDLSALAHRAAADDKVLENERRRMYEALGRLDEAESKVTRRQPVAKLFFGLDLTGSREPSLEHARIATAAMFDAITAIGAVAVKLVYYRGTNECRASKWYSDPEILCRSMLQLSCEAGHTQIARLLRVAQAEEEEISGAVFIGDHCEDDRGELLKLAKALGDKSIPLWIFHECADHDQRSLKAKPVFKQMAELSGGIYVEFKPDSGTVLSDLLPTAGAFSTAGVAGFEKIAPPKTYEAREFRNRLMLGDGRNGRLLKG